jgi:outer membrane protein assembly factor BamB
VVVGDAVVVGSDDGRLYALKLADGEQIWARELGQAVVSSPAVVDERIIIGSNDGTVYAWGATAK